MLSGIRAAADALRCEISTRVTQIVMNRVLCSEALSLCRLNKGISGKVDIEPFMFGPIKLMPVVKRELTSWRSDLDVFCDAQ